MRISPISEIEKKKGFSSSSSSFWMKFRGQPKKDEEEVKHQLFWLYYFLYIYIYVHVCARILCELIVWLEFFFFRDLIDLFPAPNSCDANRRPSYIHTTYEEEEGEEGSVYGYIHIDGRGWFDEKGFSTLVASFDSVRRGGGLGLPFFFFTILLCAAAAAACLFVCVPPPLFYEFILFISNKRQWKGTAPSASSSPSILTNPLFTFFSSFFLSFFLFLFYKLKQDRLSFSFFFTRVEFIHKAAAANLRWEIFFALLNYTEHGVVSAFGCTIRTSSWGEHTLTMYPSSSGCVMHRCSSFRDFYITKLPYICDVCAQCFVLAKK